MQHDKLIILKPEFIDPDLGGRHFYCQHCIIIEGLLAAFPDIAMRLDVERIEFAKPRLPLVELIGADNQWLPVLIFADDASTDLATGQYGAVKFANELGALLHALHVRHGFPEPHP